MDFSGQPFPAFRTNDSPTTGGVPPLLQPLLNAASTNGNSSNVSLDALRNAAAVAAAAAIGNSTPNPFPPALTSPYALSLPQHRLQQQQHHHHSSTLPLPLHATPQQITSDLMYTQSASSSLFPHSFHQQSRLTLSSSSFGAASMFDHQQHQHQQQQAAQQQFDLLQQNTQDALLATYLNSKSAPLSNTKSVAEPTVREKKSSRQHQNHQHQQQSVAGNLLANLSQSGHTSSNDAANLFATSDNSLHDPAAAQIQADLSLWYSSLAQTLATQMYFNSALKVFADNSQSLTDSGPALPAMGQMASPLTQTPSLSSLYPQLLAMAVNNAHKQQQNTAIPLSQHHPTLSFNEQTHPLKSGIEQPIALLSPNNPRYHQPLPELKISGLISPCDSSRTDLDRKKFSPDSSTAALYSPLHSPSNSIDYKFDLASQTASRAHCTSLYSPTPVKPRLLSPTHSVHDTLPSDLVSKVIQASNDLAANNANKSTMMNTTTGGKVSAKGARKTPAKSARLKPIRKQESKGRSRSKQPSPLTTTTCNTFNTTNTTSTTTNTTANTATITTTTTNNSKLAQLEFVAKQFADNKTCESPSPPLNAAIKKDAHERVVFSDEILQNLKQQLNPLSLLASLPSSDQHPQQLLPRPPPPSSPPYLPSITSVKKSFGNLKTSPLFSSTPIPSTETQPTPLLNVADQQSNPFAMINSPDLTNTQSPVVSSTKHSNVEQPNFLPPEFSSSSLCSRSSPSRSPSVPLRLISPESPSSLNRPSLSPISQNECRSPSTTNVTNTTSSSTTAITHNRMQRNVPPKKTLHPPASLQYRVNNGINNENNISTTQLTNSSLFWMPGSIEESSSLLSPPSSNSPQLDTSSAARNALVEQAIQACMSDEEETIIENDLNDRSSNVESNERPSAKRFADNKIAIDTDEESERLVIDNPTEFTASTQPSPAKNVAPVFPCIEINPLTSFAATQESKQEFRQQGTVALSHETTNGHHLPSRTDQINQQPILKLSIRRDQVDNWSTKERKTKRNKRIRNHSQCSSGSSVGVPSLSNDIEQPLIRRHSTDEMLLSKQGSQGGENGGQAEDPKPEPRVRCDTYPREEALDAAGSRSSGKRSGRKREMAAQLNPWSIRRSERIFLHAAFQTHTNSNDSSPGSLNLILTSNRKLQKDAAAAASSSATSAGPLDVSRSSNGQTFGILSNDSHASGMFSGSVSLVGSCQTAQEAEAECELLRSIVWTRQDRLPKPSEFRLHTKQLQQQRQRILLRSDELLYAGHTEYDQPMGEKSVLVRLDGESNDRRMSLQQLLGQAIREYRPTSLQQLTEGTRVCAYWSNRARCLYPGRVAKVLPSVGSSCASSATIALTLTATADRRDLILVEFDDGDKGRIDLDEIRLLPSEFSVDSLTTLNEGDVESKRLLSPSLPGSNSPTASSERVGESSIRIRLNSGGEPINKRFKHAKEHHKRHKHHHHHSKRRRHKKKSKKAVNGHNSDTDIVDEDGDDNDEECRLTTASSTSPSVGDESEDPSSDSEDDVSDDENRRKDQRKGSVDLNGIATNRSSSLSLSRMETEGSDSQWVCEVNNSSVGSRSLRRNSPNQTTCKAVIRRKQPNKSSESKRPKPGASKIAAFLPYRQLWSWHGEPNRSARKGYRPKKLFYDAIIRDDEIIRVNDCAVFLSTGRPSLPFVGRIVSLWQSPSGTMTVRVRWFYHPEETKRQPDLLDSKVGLSSSGLFD